MLLLKELKFKFITLHETFLLLVNLFIQALATPYLDFQHLCFEVDCSFWRQILRSYFDKQFQKANLPLPQKSGVGMPLK
jgi:hypothetical protein